MKGRTGKLDVLLHDCRLDLVVRVWRDAHDPGRRVQRPAELLDVRGQFITCEHTHVSTLMPIYQIPYTLETKHTREVEVRPQPLAADARERSLDGPDGNLPHCVLEADALDGVVVAETLDGVGAVEGPERGEAALLEERVELREEREQLRERVGLFGGGGRRGALVEEGDAEVEVGEGGGGERFDEDVDHDVRVVEVGVELVPVGCRD